MNTLFVVSVTFPDGRVRFLDLQGGWYSDTSGCRTEMYSKRGLECHLESCINQGKVPDLSYDLKHNIVKVEEICDMSFIAD